MDPNVQLAILWIANLVLLYTSDFFRMLMKSPIFWISAAIQLGLVYSLFAYFGALQLLVVLIGIGVFINAIAIVKINRYMRNVDNENHHRA